MLLLNLGTPDGTGYWPMRRYLKEFLSDERVIEEPRWKWWPILNLIILTMRPGRKGRDYASIWNNERDEGPLKTITRVAGGGARRAVSPSIPAVVVDWAMRYANPTTESRLEALLAAGLRPHSPGPALSAVRRRDDGHRLRPGVPRAHEDALAAGRSASHRAYYDDPVYIDRLAQSMKASLAKLDFEPERIIATFHGMPQKYFEKGDPYHCQCQKTSRLLRDALGWPEERWLTTFQSRFGNDPWLQPYTDKTVERLASEGVKRLALVAPGFSADCLETLEELDVENRHIFESNGGEKFAYLPALNDSAEGVDVIEAVVRRELGGWIELQHPSITP